MRRAKRIYRGKQNVKNLIVLKKPASAETKLFPRWWEKVLLRVKKPHFNRHISL
jgi:hypothetical protein